VTSTRATSHIVHNRTDTNDFPPSIFIDACVYHGDASAKDVADASAETRQKWMSDYEMDEESWSQFMADYKPGGDQGVYKFVCRHCELVMFNWDFS